MTASSWTPPSGPVALLLNKLDGIRRNGSGWMATCPAHEDGHASLSIGVGEDDRALIYCQAGCATEVVLDRLHLSSAELFVERAPAGLPVKRIAATYDYVGPEGRLSYQVVRYDPKGFAQRHPNGSGWVWNLSGIRRVLYRLPELMAADPMSIVFVAEGERDADHLHERSLIATCNAGGAGKWRDEYSATLAGRRVVILPDNDLAGRKHAERVLASIGSVADGRILNLPGLPDKGDVTDWLDAGHTPDELVALAEACFVDAPTSAQPAADLATYLTAVEAFLITYVAFPSEHEPVAAALWTAHAHVVERFETSPILAVTSAEMRSGKTRLLDCIELLVPHPERSITPSEAVLFTILDERPRPTLLLDEADAIFGPRTSERYEGVRAILNAGNRKGTTVPRVNMNGKRREVERFDVFGPKAVAGIGNLPTTVADRAIPIRMKRRAPGETVARFRERTARQAAAGIVFPTSVANLSTEVQVPDELNDRAADSWEPLLAIAEAAGGDWPGRAWAAAIAVSGDEQTDISVGMRLLADIRDAFDEKAATHLSTVELLDYLHELEDAPWADWYGKPISARGLARLLEPYRVHPLRQRVKGMNLRGYFRSEFEDAWQRYVAIDSEVSGTSGTSGPPEAGDDRRDELAVPGVPHVPGDAEPKVSGYSRTAHELQAALGRPPLDDLESEDELLEQLRIGA